MTQNKSILFLTKLYHPHIGGVENHIKTISRFLTKNGYSVTILTEKFNEGLTDFEIIDDVRIYRIKVPNNLVLKKFYVWKWALSNPTFFLEFDRIHVHDVFYWLYPVLPICQLKKVYITFHGYEGYPVKNKWIVHRKIAEILTKGNICVGDFMKKWYFTSPSTVIYGGVSSPNIKRNRKSLSAVFFGRLDNQTGIEEYVKAYKIVRKSYPRFSLVVVGEGELSAKIPSEVKIVPFQENIEKYIASSRFIFVSRYLSMLEALVQKKEVVATFDNPIKEDYLKMSPFRKYVRIGKNESEIAEIVLNSIKKGPDLEKIENGYKWASAQTWEKVVNAYLNLWNLPKIK